MRNYKFEKLRDSDNDISGYKLGNYYLMKHYGGFSNNYSWIINKTGESHYYQTEFWKLEESGEIELVDSCKEGKERLIELYEQDHKNTITFNTELATKMFFKAMNRR